MPIPIFNTITKPQVRPKLDPNLYPFLQLTHQQNHNSDPNWTQIHGVFPHLTITRPFLRPKSDTNPWLGCGETFGNSLRSSKWVDSSWEVLIVINVIKEKTKGGSGGFHYCVGEISPYQGPRRGSPRRECKLDHLDHFHIKNYKGALEAYFPNF